MKDKEKSRLCGKYEENTKHFLKSVKRIQRRLDPKEELILMVQG